MVQSLVKKVDILTDEVKFLVNIVQRTAISADAEENPYLAKLPCTSEEELETFNDQLKQEELFQTMVSFLLRYISCSENELIVYVRNKGLTLGLSIRCCL